MRQISRRLTLAAAATLLAVAMLPSSAHAQSGAAEVYKSNCVLCHSGDGSGNTPAGKALGAKDLRSQEVQQKKDAELIQIISQGKNKMPAFAKKLKPEEINQLVAFLRSLPKGK